MHRRRNPLHRFPGGRLPCLSVAGPFSAGGCPVFVRGPRPLLLSTSLSGTLYPILAGHLPSDSEICRNTNQRFPRFGSSTSNRRLLRVRVWCVVDVPRRADPDNPPIPIVRAWWCFPTDTHPPTYTMQPLRLLFNRPLPLFFPHPSQPS